MDKEQLIRTLVDKLVEGELTMEEAITQAFDAGYDMGYTKAEDIAEFEQDLRDSEVWIR